MVSSVLTTGELRGVLDGALQRIRASASLSDIAVFDTLNVHGFRISELAELHNWRDNGDGTVTAHTLKGSNARIIAKSDLSPIVLESIDKAVNYVFKYSVSSYERYFLSLIKAKVIKHKSKSVSTHLFRHCLIKELYQDGHSIEYIKTRMGIKSTTVVQNYIDSVLTIEFY